MKIIQAADWYEVSYKADLLFSSLKWSKCVETQTSEISKQAAEKVDNRYSAAGRHQYIYVFVIINIFMFPKHIDDIII